MGGVGWESREGYEGEVFTPGRQEVCVVKRESGGFPSDEVGSQSPTPRVKGLGVTEGRKWVVYKCRTDEPKHKEKIPTPCCFGLSTGSPLDVYRTPGLSHNGFHKTVTFCRPSPRSLHASHTRPTTILRRWRWRGTTRVVDGERERRWTKGQNER